ncbi:MAG TPA: anthranilate synthase component I family protein [Polyangiaceae bacterium]|nr:anthranilate synthase component I family protein [Polyangiaceae bacterium]
MSTVHRKTLVVDGLTPVGAYVALRRTAESGSFLLESVVPGERWGRYSILGYRPRRQVVVHGRSGVDPFAALATQVAAGGPQEPDIAAQFARAHVGTLAYDMVHYATKVEPWPKTAESEPVARLMGEATVVVFDNLTHTATIASTRRDEVERTERELGNAVPLPPLPPPDPTALPDDVSVDTDDEAFGRGVERVKEYIRAGDAFQIVLARTFSTPGEANPLEVYRALRVLSPAPYMYLLEMPALESAPAVAIAGASPETLVRVEKGQVTLRPIAGTRRRGRTPEEDEALAREMLDDPKERAEHVMLMDLARNDIGRVAVPGSIRLPQRMIVEKFSHVMHIVSEVTGQVVDGQGPWDVLRATFPAGTLSGAPKVRAMQIIRELEPRPRGAYGGAVGYVLPSGDLDFAIAIRTVVMRGDRFEVTAGAGIVADSVPALEAKETRNKARAALSAIHAARSARPRVAG